MNLGGYSKTITALVGGILGWAGTALVPDGQVDRAEYYGLAVVLATAIGVYGVTNTPASGQPDTGLSFHGDPIGHVTVIPQRPAPKVTPTVGIIQQSAPDLPQIPEQRDP